MNDWFLALTTHIPLIKGIWVVQNPFRSRFLVAGDARKHFSVKKRGFQWKGGRQFSESEVWKGFLQERQFSEEVRAIQWTAGLWKLKSCCPHPLPKNQLLPLFYGKKPPTPLIKGVNCHPLNWGGMGCQGARSCMKEHALFLQKIAVFRGHLAGDRMKLQEGFRAQESRALAKFHKNSMEILEIIWRC